MKTPPIVYGLISLCILVGIVFFVNHERALAPIQEAPVVVTPETPKPAEPKVSAYGTVKTKMGATTTFADFSLKPLSVDQDSRCPIDVTCIQAGTLKAKVLLTDSVGNKTATLEIGKPYSYDSYSITLVSATPTPNSKQPIAQSDYQFTFSVLKKAPVVTTPPAGKCYVGGCSSQLCTDQPDMVSTCIYREEFACYKTAKCERQATGQCGWTPSANLKMCIKNAQSDPIVDSPQ